MTTKDDNNKGQCISILIAFYLQATLYFYQMTTMKDSEDNDEGQQ